MLLSFDPSFLSLEKGGTGSTREYQLATCDSAESLFEIESDGEAARAKIGGELYDGLMGLRREQEDRRLLAKALAEREVLIGVGPPAVGPSASPGPSDAVVTALVGQLEADARIIFITGCREEGTMRRIEQDHPASVLIKPVRPDQSDGEIRSVLGR